MTRDSAVADDQGWYDRYVRRVNDDLTRVFPAEYADATADDPGVMAWCDGQIAAANMTGPPAPWALLITGPTGVGKTFQAYGAIRRICLRTRRITHRAESLPDLLAALRPGPAADDEIRFGDYAGAGLLLVDDLGADKVTEWSEMTLFRLVNHRCTRRLPTIWTTNLPIAPPPHGSFAGPTLQGQLSERVFSRLALSQVVPMKGDDRRRPPDAP